MDGLPQAATSTWTVSLIAPDSMLQGGLVGEGSAVSTMMLATSCSAVVTALWSLVGYSMAFGTSTSTGVVGNDQFATLDKIGPSTEPYSGATSITTYTFVAFQAMFAIITSAIISGAVVGKMKWGAFMLVSGAGSGGQDEVGRLHAGCVHCLCP